jgi:hypothetical protein
VEGKGIRSMTRGGFTLNVGGFGTGSVQGVSR